MNIISAEQDNMDMMLTQMGGKVNTIHGLICFVKFLIHDVEIFYVYNINRKNQYYLQKVLPYPVGAGEFSKPSEVLDYIKKDIEKYKNATQSSVFQEFIEINMELHHSVHHMEDLFLKYNVPHDKMDEIANKARRINELLDEIKEEIEPLKIK